MKWFLSKIVTLVEIAKPLLHNYNEQNQGREGMRNYENHRAISFLKTEEFYCSENRQNEEEPMRPPINSIWKSKMCQGNYREDILAKVLITLYQY